MDRQLDAQHTLRGDVQSTTQGCLSIGFSYNSRISNADTYTGCTDSNDVCFRNSVPLSVFGFFPLRRLYRAPDSRKLYSSTRWWGGRQCRLRCAGHRCPNNNVRVLVLVLPVPSDSHPCSISLFVSPFSTVALWTKLVGRLRTPQTVSVIKWIAPCSALSTSVRYPSRLLWAVATSA